MRARGVPNESANDPFRQLGRRVRSYSGPMSLPSRCRGGRPAAFILCAAGLSIVLAALQPGAWARQLRLINPLNIDRTEEVVELPLGQVAENLHFSAAQLRSLVATDAATNQRIPSQFFSHRNGADPDTLLLLVKLPAKRVFKERSTWIRPLRLKRR